MRCLQPWRHAAGWCVGFSGGLDSTVLLHVLATAAERGECPPLRAIHIHHGLQQVADGWPEHCQAQCDALNVPLAVVRVQVARQASVEQAARQARYAAFAAGLQKHELLLLAQHQDDQAETLLFRLLRGSGVSGLQGIPVQRSLGNGQLLRPLLGISRQQLENYAVCHGLEWVEDPSNDDDCHDRNFLRLKVLPLLKQRWPALVQVLQRTSGHMHEAGELLDDLARLDLQLARVQPLDWLELDSLRLDVLRDLSEARQKNLLRYWLADKTPAFDAQHWKGWCALRDAKADAQPLWRLDRGGLLRHREHLYWLPQAWLLPPQAPGLVVGESGCYQLPGNGVLEVKGELPGRLHLGYRQGGERLQLPGRGQRDLKRLLQEQQIPVFVRQRLPLACLDGQLLAVANCPALKSSVAGGLELVWHPPA